ncbi:MAG: hypothetical protein E5Y02_16545 [Mesorhizobium sp.]|nr:MAG: hypothetical protein E5Y02_16545 [Mesorhizobium sp.]
MVAICHPIFLARRQLLRYQNKMRTSSQARAIEASGVWNPTRLAIEPAFDRFVESYRGGVKVSKLLDPNKPTPLNADYFFAQDGVIAELKTIEGDSGADSSQAARVVASLKHFGYQERNYLNWLLAGYPLPERVARRVASMMRRPIERAAEHANKQIRATKSLLGKDCRGLLLLANDNNYGFDPIQVCAILAKFLLRLQGSHIAKLF